jgi:hypothetical protein
MKPLLVATLVVAGGLAAVPAAALPVALEARWTRVENLSRTSHPATIKDGSLYAATVTARNRRQLTADWQAAGELSAGYETVPDFGGLDAVRVAAGGELRRKFGLGPFAPVLDLRAGGGHAGFDERGRTGWQLDGGIRLGKRLNPAWQVSAGIDWTRFDAREAPFDVSHHRTWLEANWDVTRRWRLAAGVSRLDGQLTANASGAVWASALAGGFGPRIAAYYNSTPWRVSETFGARWVAYRIDARADAWFLGADLTLGDRISVPLRYERIEVVNRVDVRYVAEIWSLGIVHRF